MTNLCWIIGRVALVDVSTEAFPKAIALVSSDILPLVLDGHGRWSATRIKRGGAIYAARREDRASPLPHHQRSYLHRRAMFGYGEGPMLDHRNGDGLNCLPGNLRQTDHAGNGQNRKLNANNKTGFKGVHRHGRARKWRAQIKVDGKTVQLGEFLDLASAAAAYDRAAATLFGEFARTNAMCNPSRR